MSTKTMIDPETGLEVVNPGTPRYERAYKPIRDRYGEDFEGALEEVALLSDELRKLDRDEKSIGAIFGRRIAAQQAEISRLVARKKKALSGILRSQGWRLERLDEFFKDYAHRLRARQGQQTYILPAGEFRRRANKEKDGWITVPETDKRDDPAILKVLGRLADLGLYDAHGELVETKATLRAGELKKRFTYDEVHGHELRVVTTELPEAVEQEADAGTLRYETCERDSETGLPTAWAVYLPAVHRRVLDGVVAEERPLFQKLPPAEPYRLEFIPADEAEDTETGEETDGD